MSGRAENKKSKGYLYLTVRLIKTTKQEQESHEDYVGQKNCKYKCVPESITIASDTVQHMQILNGTLNW